MALRILSQSARFSFARGLSTTAVARKDIVQELYLKELKAFKPAPVAQDAHVGSVKEFSAPVAPSAPAALSASELAKELEAYDATSPAAPVAQASAAESEEEPAGESADAFLESLRADVAPPAAHH